MKNTKLKLNKLIKPVIMVFLLMGITSIQAQLITPFQARYSDNISGNFTMIGNQLETCPSTATNCAAARMGTASPIGNNNNNNYTMQYVDVDADPTTFNSSRARLTIPIDADIQFAGLYWGADLTASAPGIAANNPAQANQVLLRSPNSNSYITIVGALRGNSTATGNDYAAFSDVTNLVRSNGNGDYTVANVQAGTGPDRDAGWTMVVVYKSSGEPSRNIRVFDGFAAVFSSTPAVNIPISGFVTPQSGNVTTQVGVIAFEGDLGLIGDTLRLNNVLLTDSFHPSNNAFTSSISLNNLRYTDKTPNYPNTQGFDASIYSANGILGNGASSATINLTTSNDAYYPTMVAFSTNLFAPNLVATKSVVDLNGGQVLPGDTLRYTVSVNNSGGDGANNLLLNDDIPANTTYLVNSLNVLTGANAGAKTDVSNDDQAEFDGLNNRVRFRLGTGANNSVGGSLAPGITTSIRFDVVVNSDVLNQTTISNQAALGFTAATLGTSLTGVSNTADVIAVRPLLTLNKTATPNPVNAGDLITYTMNFSNNGGAPSLNSILSDVIPNNTTFVNASAGGVEIAGTVTWNLNQINPGSSGSVILTVRVDTPLPNNTVISNTAILSSDNFPNISSSVDVNVTSDPVLSINKTASSAFVSAGDFVVYTIEYANIGNDTAFNFVLTDSLPASTTFSSASSNGSLVGNDIIWSLGDLSAGAFGSVTLTVQINNPIVNGTDILNLVVGDADNALPVNSSVTITAISAPVLTIVKTDSPDPVKAGAQLTYQIDFNNIGTDTANQVAIIDDLPSEVTFISATGGALYDPVTHEVTFLIETLLAGIGGSFQVTVVVDSPLPNGYQLSNSARIRSLELGFVEVTEITTVQSAPLLLLEKSVSPEPVNAGGTLVYSISYSNIGNENATGVILRDFLPDNVTFVSASNGGTFDTVRTIEWAIGNLNIGDTGQLTLVVDVDSPLANGTRLTNSVSLLSNELPPLTDTIVSTVSSQPVLTINKSVSSQFVNPGEELVYTIDILNTGNDTATGVVIADILPANTTFLSASNSGVFDGINSVSWPIGNLIPSQVTQVTLTVMVVSPLSNGLSLINVAEVFSDQTIPVSDDATTVVLSSPILTIDKQGPAFAIPGELLTYSIVVTNVGNDVATGVIISDNIPLFTTFQSATASGLYNANDKSVIWFIGSLEAGSSVTVELTVLTDAVINNQTPVVNTASTHSDQTPPVTDTVTTVIASAPVLDISKTVDLTNVSSGGTLIYSLIVNNTGNANATNVVMTDILPPQTSFSGETGGGIDQGDGTVIWNIGTLAPGESFVATLTVTVAAVISDGSLLLNQANVVADGIQPLLASATSRVSSSPVLTINKVSSVDTVSPNEVFDYTIAVANNGADVATNVFVSDRLPNGIEFVSASAAGVFDNIDRVSWSIGTLNVGDVVNLTITVRLQNTTSDGQRLTNTAEVYSDQTPPISSSADVIVSNPVLFTSLQVIKSTNTANPSIGQIIEFTIDYAILGPSDAINVQLTDNLPIGMTFLQANNGGQYVAGQVIWSLGNLLNGQTGTVSFSVQIDTDQAGQELINTVIITADNSPSDQSQQIVNVVTIINGGSITLSKIIASGNPFSQVGDLIQYLFVVVNSGTTSLVGPVTINDDLTINESCPDLVTIGNGDNNLDPTESITCIASYAVTANDLNNGFVTNTANAVIDSIVSNNSTVTANGAIVQLAIPIPIFNLIGFILMLIFIFGVSWIYSAKRL